MNDLVATMLQMRHAADRDLTVAVAHGKTFLGGICAWIAGGSNASNMASLIMAGAPVSWGLTEQGRGSDLMRSATSADREGSKFVLSGSKWPINNATRGRAMCVLARTNPEAGPSRTFRLRPRRCRPVSLESTPRQNHSVLRRGPARCWQLVP
jgi:alkylation response protein AidB-like acyl-CoA dehydrogenase